MRYHIILCYGIISVTYYCICLINSNILSCCILITVIKQLVSVIFKLIGLCDLLCGGNSGKIIAYNNKNVYMTLWAVIAKGAGIVVRYCANSDLRIV